MAATKEVAFKSTILRQIRPTVSDASGRGCGRRTRRRANVLAVPMLKENELVGAFILYRQEVRPFTDKQIELVQKFRCPGRHRHRKHAAAQRAAGAHATTLPRRWISRRPRRRCSRSSQARLAILYPVFHTILAKAARICDAKFGMSIWLD